MFCTRCGRETTADAVYCSLCGHQVNPGKPSAQSAPKRLYRLTYDKKIAGICSGFARYLDIDVTLVRIFTVAAVCLTGFIPGTIAYCVIWAIMPLEPFPTGATIEPDAQPAPAK